MVNNLDSINQNLLVVGGDTYADPGVFERICGRHSLGWINGQHFIDKVFSLWSHRVPLGRRELFQEGHQRLQIHKY